LLDDFDDSYIDDTEKKFKLEGLTQELEMNQKESQ